MGDDLVDAVDAWVEDVTIKSETVGRSVSVRWHSAAKTVQVDLLVAIVELQDVANTLDSLQVLIALHIQEMERVWLSWVTIGRSEVDGERQVNLATTENVLEERGLSANLQVSQSERYFTFGASVLRLAFLELAERHAIDRVDDLVLATGH